MIATPTFLHRTHSLCAMAHGSHVLCEKPAAASVADVEAMIQGEKTYGRFLAIGYQWSFAPAILALKQEILSGKLGKPLTMKTMILWPRDQAYYTRGGGWGGRRMKDGRLVLDSIASNACAHYIHNMLFLLGSDLHSSASVASVEAMCLRANAIEMFDTCVMQMKTQNNVSQIGRAHV